MANESLNFIEKIIESDRESQGQDWKVHTRFPPEPNGYLHIGHAKAICLNFSIAENYGGVTNLRFDDTNPVTEDTEYVDAIKRDIQWLGYNWEDREYYASDYFPQLYGFAMQLIEKGLAYVDDSTSEEIADQKGDVNTPGTPSPYRNRSIEENRRI
ncbi:MAG: glutamine--tRNA ligase, partial [Saprospiraceae bacterium]|nr:glutamine--tRNA ligase [Saprospiraceae bacterium]